MSSGLARVVIVPRRFTRRPLRLPRSHSVSPPPDAPFSARGPACPPPPPRAPDSPLPPAVPDSPPVPAATGASTRKSPPSPASPVEPAVPPLDSPPVCAAPALPALPPKDTSGRGLMGDTSPQLAAATRAKKETRVWRDQWLISMIGYLHEGRVSRVRESRARWHGLYHECLGSSRVHESSNPCKVSTRCRSSIRFETCCRTRRAIRD